MGGPMTMYGAEFAGRAERLAEAERVMTEVDLPDDPAGPLDSARRLRRERQALSLAEQYAQTTPHYRGLQITERERDLMHLALRCYTHPTSSELELVRLQLKLAGQDLDAAAYDISAARVQGGS